MNTFYEVRKLNRTKTVQNNVTAYNMQYVCFVDVTFISVTPSAEETFLTFRPIRDLVKICISKQHSVEGI